MMLEVLAVAAMLLVASFISYYVGHYNGFTHGVDYVLEYFDWVGSLDDVE